MSKELKQILSVVVPVLRQHGYKGSGQNFHFTTTDASSVVSFQKDSGGKRFYVNVGVHPLCLGTEVSSTSSSRVLKEHDCVFRTRLSPPEGYQFGWPYDVELAECLADRFSVLFDEWVQPLVTFPGPISEARACDFSQEVAHPVFGAVTPAKLESFALICIALGNSVAAAEFLEKALAIASPNAKGLIRRLEQIRRELEP